MSVLYFHFCVIQTTINPLHSVYKVMTSQTETSVFGDCQCLAYEIIRPIDDHIA